MSMKKVALIFPRFRIKSGDSPLGIAFVAASLRSRIPVELSIFDATFTPSWGRLAAFLAEKKPDIVGIYSDTLMSDDALRAARLAKRMGIFTVAGGPHPTIMPEFFLDTVDIVVIGEGERAFADIVSRYPGNNFAGVPGLVYRRGEETVNTGPCEYITDLDTLPFPAWDLLPMDTYIRSWHYLDSYDIATRGTNIIGSRGCPFNCTYCQPTLRTMFGKKIRFHSPRYIADEIQHLQKSYGITGIFFHDDTFTSNRQWLGEVCAEIRRRSITVHWGINSRVDTIDSNMVLMMKEAGLKGVHLGAESGSQRILDTICRKGIKIEQTRAATQAVHDAGVYCFCFFMLGFPTETAHEVRETIKFSLSLPIDEASFSITTPLPMTHLHRMISNDPNYLFNKPLSGLNYYSKRSFTDPNLSNAMLHAYHLLALLLFWTRPKKLQYILHHFATWNSTVKLIRKVLRNVF
jgi:radical SAM superfamily enzyme YgiQ (UPF0313 family)